MGVGTGVRWKVESRNANLRICLVFGLFECHEAGLIMQFSIVSQGKLERSEGGSLRPTGQWHRAEHLGSQCSLLFTAFPPRLSDDIDGYS